MVTFVINILERMRTKFLFLSFKSWWIYFEVCLVTLCYFSIMFYFMRFITFDVFRPVCIASKCCIIPLSTIIALEYAWVYICISNCYDVAFYIETPINKVFSFGTTLSILNVSPYNSYI